MRILEKGFVFNKFSVLVEIDDQGNSMRLQFSEEVEDAVALAEAQRLYERQMAEIAYNAIETLAFDILEQTELLKEFVAKIKATPTITLTQYNSWLATKQWYQAAIIRYFVFTLATKLAERNEMTLTAMTETTVVTALRNWIVTNDLKTISKVVGYGAPDN